MEQRFEHKMSDANDMMDMSKKGWELVSVIYHPGYYKYDLFWKRPYNPFNKD